MWDVMNIDTIISKPFKRPTQVKANKIPNKTQNPRLKLTETTKHSI